VKIAIIGCGLIGQKRAVAAKGHEIVLVCDPDTGRRDALAARTGAKAVSDPADAMDADIVVIATPHNQLARIALAAVQAGRHVLIEKPAAVNATEARAVAEAAADRGVRVKVGFNHRFHPAIMKAHFLVQDGAVGPLLFIRGRYGHGGRVGYEKEWRFTRAISGGGELIDQGSHLIDLSRWFMGELSLSFGETRKFFWQGEVEDNCFVVLGHESGAVAWLHASWTEWKNQFSFEIMGRDGKLTIDGLGGSYGVERLTFHRMLPGMGPPETTSWEYPFPDRSFEDEFSEFVAAIEEGRAPIGNIDDAVANMRIVDAIYRQEQA
jgi:predicted dehydrogenase